MNAHSPLSIDNHLSERTPDARVASLIRSACTGLMGLAIIACDREHDAREVASASPSTSDSASTVPKKEVLAAAPEEVEQQKDVEVCPPDMVNINGAFCIDRYEASVFGKQNHEAVSPYYPPQRQLAIGGFEVGSKPLFDMDIPKLPEWQSAANYSIAAKSERDRVPSAYVSHEAAAQACESVRKRLCKSDEWIKACQGESKRVYPYGDTYEAGQCNINRGTHPAVKLFGKSGIYMTDPRYNLLKNDDGPLLEKTGTRAGCVSKWGDDGIHDMVGNLSEWVEDGRTGPKGTFLGGYYAKATEKGCLGTQTTVHSKKYYDYSLGFRCCSETAGAEVEVSAKLKIPEPKIDNYTRHNEWAQMESMGVHEMPNGPITYIVLNQSGVRTTMETELSELRRLQLQGMQDDEDDIAAHYIVGPSGNVYEGRGLEVEAAGDIGANMGRNSQSGNKCYILVLGDYKDDRQPLGNTAEVLEALIEDRKAAFNVQFKDALVQQQAELATIIGKENAKGLDQVRTRVQWPLSSTALGNLMKSKIGIKK